MRRSVALVLITLLAATAVGSDLLGCYFAPAGPGLFHARLADGVMREFICEQGSTNVICGAEGWSGEISGDDVRLVSPSDARPVWDYRFLRGRPVSVSCDGKPLALPSAEARPAQIPLIEIWPPDAEMNEEFFHEWDTWKGGTRMRLWFENPNRCGAFFALLSLVLFLLLVKRSVWMKVAVVAAVLAGVCLMRATGSRGALCAFSVGLLMIAVFGIRRIPRRLAVMCGGVAIIGMVLAIALVGPVSQAVLEKVRIDDSARQRLVMWSAVPRMMSDASGGWGFISSGRAYADWYQPFGDTFMARTLINDHVTQLVKFGWPMRVVYVFLWLCALLFMLSTARCGGSPVPFAVGLAFMITAFFNPVIESWEIWIAPVIGLAFSVAEFKRSGMSVRRHVGCIALISVLLSGVSMLFLLSWGNRTGGEPPKIRQQGSGVVLNGESARTWLVSDDAVLGVGVVEKSMRAFYRKNPSAVSCGYVYKVDDLPEKVDRLVLAGRSGAEFLAKLQDSVKLADIHLPREIVFISPTFPAWAIPDLVSSKCKVKIVIGEFLAQFDDSYAKPQDWISIIRGAELFIPGWMNLVIGK